MNAASSACFTTLLSATPIAPSGSRNRMTGPGRDWRWREYTVSIHRSQGVNWAPRRLISTWSPTRPGFPLRSRHFPCVAAARPTQRAVPACRPVAQRGDGDGGGGEEGAERPVRRKSAGPRGGRRSTGRSTPPSERRSVPPTERRLPATRLARQTVWGAADQANPCLR